MLHRNLDLQKVNLGGLASGRTPLGDLRITDEAQRLGALRAQLHDIVASNTQNRIGDPQAAVLARFPADHVSLVHSSVTPEGDAFSVYRVYAREKNRSTRFERYYVFQNDALVLLTDDEDDIETRYGSDVYHD